MYYVPITDTPPGWHRIISRSVWRGAWMGLALGGGYGATLMTAIVLFNLGSASLAEIGQGLLFIFFAACFYGGIPAAIVGALTGLAVGIQLKRQAPPVTPQRARSIGLRTAMVIAGLINGLTLLGIAFDNAPRLPSLIIYAVMLAIPSLIYLAAAARVTMRLCRI